MTHIKSITLILAVAIILCGCATTGSGKREMSKGIPTLDTAIDTLEYLNQGQPPKTPTEAAILARAAEHVAHTALAFSQTKAIEKELKWLPFTKIFGLALTGTKAYAFTQIPEMVMDTGADELREIVREEISSAGSDAAAADSGEDGSSASSQQGLQGLIDLTSNVENREALRNSKTIVTASLSDGGKTVPFAAFSSKPASELAALSPEELKREVSEGFPREGKFKLVSAPQIRSFNYDQTMAVLATLTKEESVPPGPRAKPVTQPSAAQLHKQESDQQWSYR